MPRRSSRPPATCCACPVRRRHVNASGHTRQPQQHDTCPARRIGLLQLIGVSKCGYVRNIQCVGRCAVTRGHEASSLRFTATHRPEGSPLIRCMRRHEPDRGCNGAPNRRRGRSEGCRAAGRIRDRAPSAAGASQTAGRSAAAGSRRRRRRRRRRRPGVARQP